MNSFPLLSESVPDSLRSGRNSTFARTGISGGNQEQAVRAGYTYIEAGEYFEERLYSFHSMREENRASYVLLKLEYPKMTLEEADTALQASVRENDVRGISEKESLPLLFTDGQKFLADHSCKTGK